MADLLYPPVGFHFLVTFEIPGMISNDFMFREVSGLTVSVDTEDFVEGGENRFVHSLPVRTKYSDLELKRGLLVGSMIVKWVKDAVEKFQFVPISLTVSLLNETHTPLMAWRIVNAYPVEWSVDSFNAEESKIVVETLKLKYQYFNTIRV
jgi:phage tail-like protein